MEDDLIAPNFAAGKIEQRDGQGSVLRFSTLAIDQRTLWWEPKEDITTLELARCMNLFVAGTAQIRQQLLTLFDGLPAECKRHWRVTGG
jgi:hypothetical protein